MVIGPQKNLFKLHKELLCNASTYFAAALKGNFREATTQTVEMPEADPELFRHFQHWLYSKTLLMSSKSENDIPWPVLINLFIFGEAHGIPDLQNASIDGIINKQATGRLTPLEQINHVYDNTGERSPLRRLFVDLTHTIAHFNHKCDADGWLIEAKYEMFPKRFLFDVAVEYCRKWNDDEVVDVVDFRKVRENYHVESSD